MLNLRDGRPLAQIIGGEDDREILYIDSENNPYESSDSEELGTEYEIDDGILQPLLNVDERSVAYIAGPSGSGKTTYAINLIKKYCKIFPNKDFFLFSRTDYKNDPAYRGMKVNQVKIDESIIKEPIDIEKELKSGAILLFDDCNTIQDDKIKKAIDKLMADIMEVGRKLNITIIVTNHLVIPNEKKVARTIMNEMQCLTVFPKSGSTQQITYVLKTYFGLNKKQIQEILEIPSRWVTIHKNYPMCVVYETGCFIL
jgi:Cdc6-like AAA superfamily ATPase